MDDRIVDDREDYRDWINDLINRMSDEEKAEYLKKLIPPTNSNADIVA